MLRMDTENTLKTPVLVLGATSLIGGHLLARLKAEDLDPTAFSRRPPTEETCWIGGDLKDPDLGDRLPVAATAFALSPIWLLPPVLPALKNRGMERLIAFSSTSRFTKTDSPDAGERAVALELAGAEAAVENWCAEHGVAYTTDSEMSCHPKIVELIDREIKRFNRYFGNWEHIKKFTLIDKPWCVDAGELAPTLKLRRKVIAERCRAMIESLYAPA